MIGYMQYSFRNAAKHLAARTTFFCLFVAILFLQPAYAENATPLPDQWQISFMPYFYVPRADADLDIGGLSGPVELSYSEVINYLDFTAMGRVEAWKGRWGLIFDGLFMNLEIPTSLQSPTTGATVNLALDERLGSADFGLSYRLLDLPLGQDNVRRLALEPYAGLRYAYLRQVVDLQTNGTTLSLGHSEDWVEPFVGGRVRWTLNETVGFDIRADAGGFGIGAASDLTWELVFQLNYELSDNTSLNIGYRIDELDYHTGSGLDELGIDVRAKGPFLGLTFVF